MDTLKTAAVVVLLLAVVYGVYVVVNKPEGPLPQEIAWHDQKADEPLQIDLGDGGAGRGLSPSGGLPSGGPSPLIHAELSPEPAALAAGPSAPSGGLPLPLGPSTLPAGSGSAASPVSAPATLWPTSTVEATSSGAASSTGSGDESGSARMPSAPSLLAAGSAVTPSPGAANIAPPSGAAAGGDASSQSWSALPALREPPQDSAVAESTTPDALATTVSAQPANAQGALDPAAGIGTQSSAADLANSDPANDPLATSPHAANSLVADAAGAAALGAAALGADAHSAASAAGSPDGSAALGALGAASGSTNVLYDTAIREAHSLIEAGEWYQALFVLSKFYSSPDLTSEQHQQLVDLLDPLAAKVVYSTEHLIEQAHEVTRADTLKGIADRYHVPAELLANINGIEQPDVLVPGTKLKVVRGPFRADVDRSKSELTLFAGQLYAGRFPVTLGSDPAPKPGEFRVLEKQPGRVYYAGDGRTIPSDDPANPYGDVWIGLGSDLCIHGSAESGDAPTAGCISLSPRDAYDVYCILSSGSSVVIR
ncbi:MAG: L,D-transpeptidase family protein [Pirellulaceae bacterium]